MVVRKQTDEQSDTLNLAESIAPLPAKEAKEKLSPWRVYTAENAPALQIVLLDLDGQGYFIYKVICRQETGSFIIIAKPKNYVNQASGIRKQLENISKSFAAMLALDKEALATARKE